MATREKGSHRETVEELAAEGEVAMRDLPGDTVGPMPGEPRVKRSLLTRIGGAFAWGARHGGTTRF